MDDFVKILKKIKTLYTKKTPTIPTTFCVFPWIGLYVSTLGDFYSCCLNENDSFEKNSMKDDHGNKLNASRIKDIGRHWNSKAMKKMRKKMLNGEWPEECYSCKSQEEAGFVSYRASELNNYIDVIPDLIRNTKSNGHTPMRLLQLDIKPGNICNLKCAMCSPANSRLTIEDKKKLIPRREEDFYQQYLDPDWFERDEFWNEALVLASQVRRFNFAGGEPFLSKKLQEFLKNCVELGYAPNIEISFNTNLTVLPKQLYELWPHFKGIILYVSLDGTEAVNRYIRYPGKWEQVMKNLSFLDENIKKLNCTLVRIHTVVQIYNLFNFPEIIKLIAGRFKNIYPIPNFFPLEFPNPLNIQCLPAEIKLSAQSYLSEFIEKLPNFVSSKYELDDCTIKLQAMKKHLDVEYNLPNFDKEIQHYTEIYNNLRGADIYEIQPQLLPLKKSNGLIEKYHG